jgi:hypothetical protein
MNDLCVDSLTRHHVQLDPMLTAALRQAKDKDSRKDKRHLYLAKEGEITEGSAAWAGMSEHDRWAAGRQAGRDMVRSCMRAAITRV